LASSGEGLILRVLFFEGIEEVSLGKPRDGLEVNGAESLGRVLVLNTQLGLWSMPPAARASSWRGARFQAIVTV